MKTFLIVLTIIFFQANVQATEIFENFMNTRALGMGNAFSAVVDDHNALWYNPAALDRIKGLHLTLLDFQVGTDAYDIYTTYQNAVGSGYSNLIRSFYGKQVWMGISDALAFSMRGFAMAGYDYFNLSFNLHNPAFSNVTMNATNDVGFNSGFAFSLIPDALRFGVVVKRVTRYGGRIPFGPATLASLSNSYITSLINNVGTGYGLDSGLLIELPYGIKPSFSFVWHDIGQTRFIPNPGSLAPPVMDDEAVAGFSATVDATVVKIRPAIDFKHINIPEEQIGKRIHVGTELEFPGLAVRFGANQGYYTAGVTLNFKYVKFEAATYGIEVGAYPGQTEDRRYIGTFTIDLNMDPSFDFSSTAGARPRAFQRR